MPARGGDICDPGMYVTPQAHFIRVPFTIEALGPGPHLSGVKPTAARYLKM